MKSSMKQLSLFFCLTFILFACGEDDDTKQPPADTFDRTQMLTNWADNIIVPGLENFVQQAEELDQASKNFAATPDATNLTAVRLTWTTAYRAWQSIAMFDIGKAEEVFFRNNLNIYPVDVNAVLAHINDGTYNLELPSEIDKQGFSALDYMLYGLANNDAAILAIYNGSQTADYLDYLNALTARISMISTQILADWNGGFRDSFINNSGNSASASVDKLVNDYIFYYERFLRAGKVGIPAGVFSGAPLANLVEAPYRDDLSKTLLLDAIDAAQDFFNGISYIGSNKGPSLADYLDELSVEKNGQLLSLTVNERFDAARNKAQQLNDSFATQVLTDNNAMLETYDLLQMNVVLLKVDMLQALNISVDYVDADGD